MADKEFPEGFLWGASTAAYQVEGGIENVDWAEAAREGKVPEAGRACDFYNRFGSDFEIAASLGMNAQRFSIEWARIEPEEGKFNEREIEHYRAVLERLKASGVTPMVNLWHFTLPLWFSERGGFLEKGAPEIFARYCRFVVERLGGYADLWLTHNEPIVYSSKGFWDGVWPPFLRNPLQYLRVIYAVAAAHRTAYTAMKTVRPSIQIGIAKHNIFFESNSNPLNRLLCVCSDWFWNHRFLRLIEGYQDFIGLNHYHHKKYGATSRERETAVRSDMGWEIHPTSLYHCLIALKRYGLPLYVSEHGLADAADVHRPEFIKNAARAVHRAIEEGAPVRGYFHWSLLDNYEWTEGFTKRFGLIEVNYDTLERTIRPSAYVYKQIIERNALID
ncbi:glycoside hydrolase family 1 protein [Candidatus Kaiserbacteria bacterium]|nr:glycoside hydrolase family 1 protein [Candidatus Kaiserbacteria bacterium]